MEMVKYAVEMAVGEKEEMTMEFVEVKNWELGDV